MSAGQVEDLLSPRAGETREPVGLLVRPAGEGQAARLAALSCPMNCCTA